MQHQLMAEPLAKLATIEPIQNENVLKSGHLRIKLFAITFASILSFTRIFCVLTSFSKFANKSVNIKDRKSVV